MDSRKTISAGVVSFVFAAAQGAEVLAQDPGPDTALAGMGGGANGAANGGAIAAGDIGSGANAGPSIGVGDTAGDVSATGGMMANTTDGILDADGGTVIADGSGGSFNYADPSPFS